MCVCETELENIRSMLKSVASSFDAIEAKLANTPPIQLRDMALDLRRTRDSLFPEGYFSDPAWDMLLELDKAERLGRRFVVSNIGLTAAISPSTALRHLVRLEADGFVKRFSDPQDRRRFYVTLTPSGKALLSRVFEVTVEKNELALAS